MLSILRSALRKSPARNEPERRPVIDRLEGRLYFAHLGHEVFLPDAASNGASGLDRVAETYTFADHRRSKLFPSA